MSVQETLNYEDDPHDEISRRISAPSHSHYVSESFCFVCLRVCCSRKFPWRIFGWIAVWIILLLTFGTLLFALTDPDWYAAGDAAGTHTEYSLFIEKVYSIPGVSQSATEYTIAPGCTANGEAVVKDSDCSSLECARAFSLLDGLQLAGSLLYFLWNYRKVMHSQSPAQQGNFVMGILASVILGIICLASFRSINFPKLGQDTSTGTGLTIYIVSLCVRAAVVIALCFDYHCNCRCIKSNDSLLGENQNPNHHQYQGADRNS